VALNTINHKPNLKIHLTKLNSKLPVYSIHDIIRNKPLMDWKTALSDLYATVFFQYNTPSPHWGKMQREN
jgi:hypothetical protein